MRLVYAWTQRSGCFEAAFVGYLLVKLGIIAV